RIVNEDPYRNRQPLRLCLISLVEQEAGLSQKAGLLVDVRLDFGRTDPRLFRLGHRTLSRVADVSDTLGPSVAPVGSLPFSLYCDHGEARPHRGHENAAPGSLGRGEPFHFWRGPLPAHSATASEPLQLFLDLPVFTLPV